MSFIEDNLIVANGSITHHGDAIAGDEELSPTLKNLGVNMVKAYTPRSPWSHKAALRHRVKVKDTGLFETANFTGFRLPP